MVLPKGSGGGHEEITQRLQTFSYKMNKFQESNVHHDDHS